MPDDGRLGSVARRLAATRRVLVVEDEHDIAEFLRAYFRASGYDLVHVDPDTDLEVLDAIDEHQPDCVLLDLQLRGFDGGTAYRLVRTDDRYAYLPVLVVSARHDARSVVQPGGLDGVVSKPFNAKTLAEQVAERIERAQRLRRAAGDDAAGLHPAGYVEARLTDLLAVRGDEPVSFALVRLCSLAEITTAVGDDGAAFVEAWVARRAREALPSDSVIGRGSDGDVAMLLPDLGASEAQGTLRSVLDAVGTEVALPGGAVVPVRLAAGVAGHPEHAADPSGLYMAADAALTDAVERDTDVAVAR